MKFQYSLPMKLLALLLLFVLLTGAGVGFCGTVICGEAGAFETGTGFFDSVLAYRACRDYACNIQQILLLFANDQRTTISSQNYLESMRETFSSENCNVRVVLEDEDTGSTLNLDDLLGINYDRIPEGQEKIIMNETVYIEVYGGILGRWIGLDRRLAETAAAKASEDEHIDGVDYGSSYRGSYGYEYDESKTPDYINYPITVYCYADTALPANDAVRQAYYQFRAMKDYAYPALVLFAGCALLALLDWIFLMCAAGHRPNTDREVITLRFIDRVPYDLFTAVCAAAAVPLLIALSELELVYIRQNGDKLFLIVLFAAAALLMEMFFALFTLSSAARWKSHTLLRNSIIWRICAWFWRSVSGSAGKVAERLQPREISPQEEAQKQEQRAQKQEQRAQTMTKVGKGAQSVFGVLGGVFGAVGRWVARLWQKLCNMFAILPMAWKGLLLLFVVGFVNLFLFILIICDDNVFFVLLLTVFDMAVIWGYLSFLREMVWLHEGAKKIAAGDLDYRVPSDVMHWEFQAHGEALNAIRDGIDAAVEERVQAVEERIKSERMRNELLTNVSHDIKTPLTSIINYVGLLQKEPIEGEKAREYIEVLDRQSIRLKKLLEDLLEASKASTGNITVDAMPTSVGELLRQVVGEYAEKLSAAGIEPIITIPAQDAMIFADGRLLWRIFDNLMANIVKYAMPQTRVYLDLSSDASITAVAIKNVSRERLNIDPDELIERFVRGDTSRSTEGSGLGLSIAQSLTELMGGTFQLTIDGDLFKVLLTFPTLHDIPEKEPDAPGSGAAVDAHPVAAPIFKSPYKKRYTLKMATMAKAAAMEKAAAEAAKKAPAGALEPESEGAERPAAEERALSGPESTAASSTAEETSEIPEAAEQPEASSETADIGEEAPEVLAEQESATDAPVSEK